MKFITVLLIVIIKGWEEIASSSIIHAMKQLVGRGGAGEVFNASSALLMPQGVAKLKKHMQLLFEKLLQDQLTFAQLLTLFPPPADEQPERERSKGERRDRERTRTRERPPTDEAPGSSSLLQRDRDLEERQRRLRAVEGAVSDARSATKQRDEEARRRPRDLIDSLPDADSEEIRVQKDRVKPIGFSFGSGMHQLEPLYCMLQLQAASVLYVRVKYSDFEL